MNTALAQQIANEGGVEAWMIAQQHKSLLRFLTCGSVDDGKSTLIGRLLHDTRQIYEDQLSSLHSTDGFCERQTVSGFIVAVLYSGQLCSDLRQTAV